MSLEAPNQLPGGLNHLSHSSIEKYLKCPEKWRRHYLEGEYEPSGGYQIVGRAIHAAAAQSYHTQIEKGFPHSLEQVLDEYRTNMENEQREEAEIDWDGEDPGKMLDRGASIYAEYHRVIVPSMLPEKAELEFNVRLHPDNEWTIKGYIDVLSGYDDGFLQRPVSPHDIKTVKKTHNYSDSIQATLYTCATIQEDEDEKTFFIHELKELKDGPHADLREVTRTREAQMDYLRRVALIAREIEWRTQTGTWQGAAPGTWWCSQRYCGFWNTCPLAAK